jgi:hypothetical protein
MDRFSRLIFPCFWVWAIKDPFPPVVYCVYLRLELDGHNTFTQGWNLGKREFSMRGNPEVTNIKPLVINLFHAVE